MTNSFKFDMIISISIVITAILLGLGLGFHERNERLSHEYVVSSNFGKIQYYIDDYTIEDGSIVFYIDGVKYHLTDYSIREIEK